MYAGDNPYCRMLLARFLFLYGTTVSEGKNTHSVLCSVGSRNIHQSQLNKMCVYVEGGLRNGGLHSLPGEIVMGLPGFHRALHSFPSHHGFIIRDDADNIVLQ